MLGLEDLLNHIRSCPRAMLPPLRLTVDRGGWFLLAPGGSGRCRTRSLACGDFHLSFDKPHCSPIPPSLRSTILYPLFSYCTARTMEARFHSISLFSRTPGPSSQSVLGNVEVLMMGHILAGVCVARTSGSPKVNLSILADRDLGEKRAPTLPLM